MPVEITEDYQDLDITKLATPDPDFHYYNADTRDEAALRRLLRRGYSFVKQDEAKDLGMIETPQFQEQLKGLGFGKSKKSSVDGFVHISPDLVLMKMPMEKYIKLSQFEKSIMARSTAGEQKQKLEHNFKNMDKEAVAELGDDGRGIPGTDKKYVNQTLSNN